VSFLQFARRAPKLLAQRGDFFLQVISNLPSMFAYRSADGIGQPAVPGKVQLEVFRDALIDASVPIRPIVDACCARASRSLRARSRSFLASRSSTSACHFVNSSALSPSSLSR